MRSYLLLAPKYLAAHKKRSRLAMISVIIAVTLVSGIFSILDSLVSFEREQILKTEGNYHILVRNPSHDEILQIQSRFDVLNCGMLKEFSNGKIRDEDATFAAIDPNFAGNLNINIKEGAYPEASDEIMLEKWYMNRADLKVGDTVTLNLPKKDNSRKYVISGMIHDWGVTKANSIPVVFISMKAASLLPAQKSSYFILFKNGVNIKKAEAEITNVLKLTDQRIGRNERLLALMLQSSNNRVLKIYAIGVVLFLLVLITAVVMIYNTFNISVMERVQQFGLLRCIGSSGQQIKRLVRKEGLLIAAKAIPFGLVFGSFMSLICLAVLRWFNPKIYGSITIIRFSPIGILAGIILGFLTVLLALLSPAKKASRVSPANALTGNNEIKVLKKKKAGLLTKLLPVEIAMGIQNATRRKKTLLLMSCSFALSIIMFLLFESLINPDVMGVRPIMPYTADVRLLSDSGIGEDRIGELVGIDGVKRVNGRMESFVKASFPADRLTSFYKEKAKNIRTGEDGFLADAEKSWLISYDSKQLRWAKKYLIKGSAEEAYLNKHSGIIAVNKVYRNNSLTKTTDFKLGDTVWIPAKNGRIKFIVMGIADSIPYATDNMVMSAFITTEKLYKEVSENSAYQEVDIQLKKQNQDAALDQIKALAGKSVKVGDRRQMNLENNSAYMTAAVFIYGFVFVIALISILNIINTMNTSVAAKMKMLGIMRAVGMSSDQVSSMVITESATFCLAGCLSGCIPGIFLQKIFADFIVIPWSFPMIPVLLIILTSMLASYAAVLSPLRQIKKRGISEVISTL
jgi:putative ABC transport system permease protein